MNNYIPADKNAKLKLEETNPLYIEIFDRRSEGKCDECEYMNSNTCESCAHNPESDIRLIRMSEISIRSIRRAKKISERPKILRSIIGREKCPCCDQSKGWTRNLIIYFSNYDAQIKLGECVANYCPICGRNMNN